MAGEIGPPATSCSLASRSFCRSTKRKTRARHKVCQRVFGPEADRFCRTSAGGVATDLSEPGADRDIHDGGTDSTDGATHTGTEVQGLVLRLVEEGYLLRRWLRRAAALEIV